MTGRERIRAFCTNLRADSKKNDEIAGKLITNSIEMEELASKLEKILPVCSDEQCEQIVRDWGPERP